MQIKGKIPGNTDVLFQEEVNPSQEAWLQNPTNKFFLYSEGYKEAGDRIYEVINQNNFYANTLIYPLLFNYRQFVELRLKELIIMGYKYLDQGKDFADEHSLSILWATFRNEILSKLHDLKDFQNEFNNVERVIDSFNQEDPKSMNFRYPVSRGPKRKANIKRSTIDIENFKNVMDKLVFFFNWQWETLSNFQDLKEEIMAEIYSEYY